MNKLMIVILLTSTSSVYAQDTYWQQEVQYQIDVELNDQAHTLNGHVTLKYFNRSPDTLQFIWFHLWPNAYRNEKTALGRQLQSDRSRKRIRESERGYIDSLQFRSGEALLQQEPHPEHIDIVKVVLDQPLIPGDSVQIATPFYVKLPSYFSRSGHAGNQYMICQWYPKPAVYDSRGWHPMPYLDQGEFYSEFGRFEVNITLPSDYIVGATGTLISRDEFNSYKNIGRKNNLERSTLERYKPLNDSARKTLRFQADSVHDFAWFADKDFVIRYDTLTLKSGRVVDAFSYHQPNGNREWMNSIEFLKDAVRSFSNWVGEYPYPTVAAVEGPRNHSSGGMEYPMITLITSPQASREYLDAVITHEVGHNWFYGILGSNEREHPWMDEGLNTYYQFRYEAEKYRYNSIFGNSMPAELRSLPADQFRSRVYDALSTLPAQKAITTNSTDFSNKEEYGIVVYIKTAVWMFMLENEIGKQALDEGIREYYRRWKFRHPYPEDLKQAIEQGSGKQAPEVFNLLNKQGNLN